MLLYVELQDSVSCVLDFYMLINVYLFAFVLSGEQDDVTLTQGKERGDIRNGAACFSIEALGLSSNIGFWQPLADAEAFIKTTTHSRGKRRRLEACTKCDCIVVSASKARADTLA